MANNDLNRNYMYGLAMPSQEQQNQALQNRVDVMPFVERILSGEQVQGVTPKMARELMGIITPEVLGNFAARGYDVNPNWYQNYIEPGRVHYNTYNDIFNYAAGVSELEDVPDYMRIRAMQALNNPVYQRAGAAPTYYQQMMQDNETMMRMNYQGQVYDPWTGGFRMDPSVEGQIFAQSMQNSGLGPSLLELANQQLQGILAPTSGTPTTPNVNTGPTGMSAQGGQPQAQSPSLPQFVAPMLSYQGQAQAPQVPRQAMPQAAQQQGQQGQQQLGFEPTQDTWYRHAATVVQANALGLPLETYTEAVNIINDYLGQGGDPGQLDALLRQTYGLTLDDFQRVNTPFWHMNKLPWQ